MGTPKRPGFRTELYEFSFKRKRVSGPLYEKVTDEIITHTIWELHELNFRHDLLEIEGLRTGDPGTVDLVRGGEVPDRLGELCVDSVDLRVDFGAVTRQSSLVLWRTRTKRTHPLLAMNRSYTYNLTLRSKSTMKRQSATIVGGGGGSNRRERRMNFICNVVRKLFAFLQGVSSTMKEDVTHPSIVRESEGRVLPVRWLGIPEDTINDTSPVATRLRRIYRVA